MNTNNSPNKNDLSMNTDYSNNIAVVYICGSNHNLLINNRLR